MTTVVSPMDFINRSICFISVVILCSEPPQAISGPGGTPGIHSRK